MHKERKRIISPFAIISVSIFIVIGILYFLSDISYAAADFLNATVCHTFRIAMASVGDLFPFSLLEALIICLPIIIFLVIYRAVKAFSDPAGRLRFIINLAAAVLLIYSGHLLALGIAHNTTPLSDRMELSEVEVSEENLTDTLTDIIEEINSLAPVVPRDADGIFTHGYSYDELSEIISPLYSSFAEQYNLPRGYSGRAKGVRNGWAMSYLGITGIYSYITGEANVNTYYPDYVTLFTTAHEMSHQRGILRENEANFVAYILLSSSEDESLRYSAALNMYSYFASALYRTNKDAYYQLIPTLSDMAKDDIRFANAVSDKYGDTFIEDISEWINDLYLESSGSEGIISYSRVVELVLSYRYKTE